MPEIVERLTSLNSTWAPDKYWLWSPIELHIRWRNEHVLKKDPNFKKKDNLVIVTCEYEEAPVIAALYLREVHDLVDETYYDVKENKLYLYYGGRSDSKEKEEEKNLVLGIARRKTLAVIKKTFFSENMTSIMMDKYGQRLFKKTTAPAEIRNFA